MVAQVDGSGLLIAATGTIWKDPLKASAVRVAVAVTGIGVPELCRLMLAPARYVPAVKI